MDDFVSRCNVLCPSAKFLNLILTGRSDILGLTLEILTLWDFVIEVNTTIFGYWISFLINIFQKTAMASDSL